MQKIREYFSEKIRAQEMNKITEVREEVNRFDARFRVFTWGRGPSNIAAPWLFGCGVMEVIKR